MSQIDYDKENGKFTVNSDLTKATVKYPHDDIPRQIDLSVTTNGHLRGFVQPAAPSEKLALGSIKKLIKQGDFNPDLNDYAKLVYREVPDQNGVIRLVADWVYEDIQINDQSLTMPAGSPSAILFTEKIAKMEKLPMPEKGQREEAILHGYVTDIKGNLYTPSLWRRKGQDDSMFFSGDNNLFDREKYLAAIGKKDQSLS